MFEPVIAGDEVPVLNVVHQVLHKKGVAVPEAIREIEAAAEALLLSPLDKSCGVADGRPIDVDAEHQIRGEPGREPGEDVLAVRADEVRDDVAARPIPALELVVIVRSGRSPRVLDSNIQPVLPEESNEMHAAYAAHGESFGQEVCGEEATDAAAHALAARIVPVELAVEPEITADEQITIDVAEAKLEVGAGEIVGPDRKSVV